ncbi:MAG: DUF3592 domain-containing protein [Oscillospiraceae bacterium]|nr:DUF3592 domain-containing protein [Oscillospiraceae bacterium]
MREDIIAAAIGVGVIAAVLLTLGIIPLVFYLRLTRGTTAAATVTEHTYDTPVRAGRRHHSARVWMLTFKYSVNGAEYERQYGLCKPSWYLDAHPVGSEMKILVDRKNPKRFVLPEDKRVMLILSWVFIPFGVLCLFGVANLLLE